MSFCVHANLFSTLMIPLVDWKTPVQISNTALEYCVLLLRNVQTAY